MPLLGTAHGVPVTLVSVDEARATPIWLDKPVVTRPYTPRPSGRASRAPASGLDAYSDAVLHESLACLRAYHAAQPDWWTCQARALCIAARPPCELAACVEAAEREPGTSRWAHVLHTNDTDAEVQCVSPHRSFACTAARTAWLGECACAGYVHQRLTTVHAHGGASLVVVDPPWPNWSAKRAQGYDTLVDLYEMWRIRPALESLLGPDTLLAVWVTNAPRVQRFVAEKLMPALGLVHQATWAWLKVTAPTADAPPDQVVPLHGDARPFRRPYELVFLGARTPQCVPQRHMLVSVPLGHSAKPYLGGALGVHNPVVVELFARHVSAGRGTGVHISVGNEAVQGNEVRGMGM